ncbi:MAG: glycosyltransferase [Candidatus Peregrinibacteria bacterium]|nr:glycosyltransferase [Candidatus Peregrinibacteria bacterium]MDZ4245444.1 glycosyltransferase [Candidatus Gracilibacteria bacterium]
MSNKSIFYFLDFICDCNTNTGVQRVSRSLAKALIESGRKLIFVRWDERGKSIRIASQEEVKILEMWNGPKISEWVDLSKHPSKAYASESLHESRFANDMKGSWLLVPEVTHITNLSYAPTDELINYAKRTAMKTAFIFYDAIPFKLDEYHEMKDKHAKYMQDIALADLILPISEFASDDLKTYYCERMFFSEKTLPSIIPLPLAGELPNVKRVHEYSEPDKDKRIILCVGTIEKRKNQTTLLDAFNTFCSKNPEMDIDLVLVGNLHPTISPYLTQMTESNPYIKYLKYVHDDELQALYKRALFTVFPSLEEGFGLPIIESLWYGKPSVCADFGAMKEIADDGGCLAVDVSSQKALGAAIENMLQDHDLRSRLGKEATARKIKTWQRYSEEMLAIFEKYDDPMTKLNKIYYLADHTCSYPRNTGIQRVTRMLASSLERLGAPMQIVKWNHEKNELMSLDKQEKEHLSLWNGPEFSLENDVLFEDLAGSWLFVPELTTYAGGGFMARLINFAREHSMKVAIVFYDAIPHKLKELYPPEATSAHREYMNALGFADHVFCISETSKNDLLDYCYKLDTYFNDLIKKIHATPLATEFLERPRILSHGEKQSNTVKILAVGTVEPRKNHKTLLKAFNKMCEEHPKNNFELILAGGAPFPELEKMVEDAKKENKSIKWLRETNDEELSRLYEECDFTVYPSIEEGFGLPIVESIWHARPCIAHNQGALEEVARDGGCIVINMHEVIELKDAMTKLALNKYALAGLAKKARERRMKTWDDYGKEIVDHLVGDVVKGIQSKNCEKSDHANTKFYRPLLSICVTTYNRAKWLNISLAVLMKLTEPYRDIVEVIVCDNASTDNTAEVAQHYDGVENFQYFCNPVNVGMLGNLHVTARHSSGQYVWLVGDDDIIKPKAIECIIKAILTYPRLSLIYLNYAYTTQNSLESSDDLDSFISHGIPIVPASSDFYGKIKEIAPNNENFFTAIYACVFRRDHALMAYSQDTMGRPFSSLLTCVPTTYHVCNNMFDEFGYWIGDPALVVNMNVSWGKYATLWRLERIPEIYALAQMKGASPIKMDGWRTNNCKDITYYLNEIYFNDIAKNLPYFSIERFILNNKHLEVFKAQLPEIKTICKKAFTAGSFGQLSPDEVFFKFDLSYL